jgi:hypothetical protein
MHRNLSSIYRSQGYQRYMWKIDRTLRHKIVVVGSVAIAWLGSMATKQIKGQYRVHAL